MPKRKTQISLAARHLVDTRSGGYCEARIPGICAGQAQHKHHRKRASQGGEGDAFNLINLCFRCHEYAHRNPKWSYEVGLLFHGWDEISIAPEDVRYKIRGSIEAR